MSVDSQPPDTRCSTVGLSVVSFRDYSRAIACLESAVRHRPDSYALRLLLIETGPVAPPTTVPVELLGCDFESLHLPENRGYGWALAHAVDRLKDCDALILSNADILFLESSIELLVSAALAGCIAAPFQFESSTAVSPHPDTVLSNPALDDSLSRWLGIGRRRVHAARERELRRLLTSGETHAELGSAFSLSGAVLAVAPIVLESVGGIPQEFFLQEEDRLLCARARERKVRLVVTGSVVHLGGLRQGRSSASGVKTQLLSERQIWRQLGLDHRWLHEVVLTVGVTARVVAGVGSRRWSRPEALALLRRLWGASP